MYVYEYVHIYRRGALPVVMQISALNFLSLCFLTPHCTSCNASARALEYLASLRWRQDRRVYLDDEEAASPFVLVPEDSLCV